MYSAFDLARFWDASKLAALFAGLPVGVVVHGLDGRIVSANRSALEIIGLSLDEITGKTSMDPDWQTIREDGRPYHGAEHPVMICLAEGAPIRNAVMGVKRRTNGMLRWLRIHANPLWVDGTLVGAYSCFEDITERRRIEEQLDMALLGANLGIYEADLRSGGVKVNARYLDILGYVPGELEMSVAEWMARIHPDDFPRIKATYDHVRASPIQYVNNEYRLRHKDGGWVWLLDSGRVLDVDERGEAVRIAGTQMDITARKQAEALLRQQRDAAEQALALQVAYQTVAGIAHELNQPLNALTTLGEAAERQASQSPDLPPRLQQTLAGMVGAARRAGSVLGELIDVLRQPAALGGIARLDSLVDEVMAQARAALPFAGRVDARLPPEPVWVAGDKTQLEKVLLNLVRNAIEACRDRKTSGHIVVEADRIDAAVLICVTDNGPGIDPARHFDLFHPFASKKPGGTGMGLAIGRALVESLGGRMWHEPATGGGARFCLQLPRVQPAEDA